METNNPHNNHNLQEPHPQAPLLEDIAQGALIDFGYTPEEKILIKVVGIGGGGGNAIKRMIADGVKNVTYLAVNTDEQDLNKLEGAEKLVIGKKLTKGYGAGNDPERGRLAAEESADEIRRLLMDGQTEIVFITAGIGGGTGTGASPVVAHIAKKELGLLTIAIVSIPDIREEGHQKTIKALEAVRKLQSEVDSLILINNTKVMQVHGDRPLGEALYYANQTIVNATRSIADLISRTGEINADPNDVRATLKDGGMAIISSAEGEGENRVRDAIAKATNSPLLNGNDLSRTSRLIFFIYSSHDKEVTPNEKSVVTALTNSIIRDYSYKWGWGYDDTLKDKVRVTILAAGFGFESTERDVTQALNSSDQDIREQTALKMEQNRKLIETYYGETSGDFLATQAYPFILYDQELDNEEMIKILDNNPSVSRNHYTLEMIRSQNKGASRPFQAYIERGKQSLEEQMSIDKQPETPSQESDQQILF